MTGLLLLAIRKMRQNRWFTFATFFGLLLAISLALCIPMYADGSLKRVARDMLASDQGKIPKTSLYIAFQAQDRTATDIERFRRLDAWIRQFAADKIGFPIRRQVGKWSLRSGNVRVIGQTKAVGALSQPVRMKLSVQSGLRDMVKLAEGRWPDGSAGQNDGVFQAVVADEALASNGWRIGERVSYAAEAEAGRRISLSLQIVGSFEPIDRDDPRWGIMGEDAEADLYVDENQFLSGIVGEAGAILNRAGWYFDYNLDELRMGQLLPLIHRLGRLNLQLHEALPGTEANLTFLPLLTELLKESRRLLSIMVALALPTIFLTLYFTSRNAAQSLERQRIDIAVLGDRGTSPRQLVFLYLFESVILVVGAFVAGLGVAWLLAHAIGASSGFLTFVRGRPFTAGLPPSALWLGIATSLFAITVNTFPVRQYANASVVDVGRGKVVDAAPLWRRLYGDVALAVTVMTCGFGLSQGWIRLSGGTDSLDSTIVFYMLPGLFLFCGSLLLLRIQPVAFSLFERWLGKKIPLFAHLAMKMWIFRPSAYYPIIVLLTLTVGMGIYNASAARTMDINMKEQIEYRFGGDVTIRTAWEGTRDERDPNKIYYTEPNFNVYRELPGVQQATRVLRTTAKAEIGGRAAGEVALHAIDNVDYAKVASLAEDWFPMHPFRYLDVLGSHEQSAIVSADMARRYRIETGDTITLSVGYDRTNIPFTVAAVVSLWPTLDPNDGPFMIANLDYVFANADPIPYEVWLRTADDFNLPSALEALASRGIALTSVDDKRGEQLERLQHPSHSGVQGILSLDFLVSLLISLIGCLSFWLVMWSRRIVQFGVLRASGLTRGQLTGMLLTEQLLAAGAAVPAGMMLGMLASRVFLPLLQKAKGASSAIPPLKIIVLREDMFLIALFVSLLLALCMAILFFCMRNMAAHQVIKMGEDR